MLKHKSFIAVLCIASALGGARLYPDWLFRLAPTA